MALRNVPLLTIGMLASACAGGHLPPRLPYDYAIERSDASGSTVRLELLILEIGSGDALNYSLELLAGDGEDPEVQAVVRDGILENRPGDILDGIEEYARHENSRTTRRATLELPAGATTWVRVFRKENEVFLELTPTLQDNGDLFLEYDVRHSRTEPKTLGCVTRGFTLRHQSVGVFGGFSFRDAERRRRSGWARSSVLDTSQRFWNLYCVFRRVGEEHAAYRRNQDQSRPARRPLRRRLVN